jgi:hypothetical protein
MTTTETDVEPREKETFWDMHEDLQHFHCVRLPIDRIALSRVLTTYDEKHI